MSKWLLIGLALLSSCATRPPATTTVERATDQKTQRRDSLTSSSSYVEKVRLTPVAVGADVVPFTTQLEVNPATGKLKPATYTSRGRRATASFHVDAEGKVTGECGCEAEQAIIAVKDRIIELQSEQKQYLSDELRKQEVRTVEVPVPYTAWYDKVARLMAAAFVAGLLLLLWLYFNHRAPRPQPDDDDARPL